MEPITKKLDILKDGKDLTLYFLFSSLNTNIPLNGITKTEMFNTIVSYSEKEALDILNLMSSVIYNNSVDRKVRKLGEIKIKDILDRVNFQSKEDKKTVKEFVWGMMLIADKFVEDEEDKKTLKNILDKIKVYG